MSAAARDSVNKWYDETLVTRLDDKHEGAIILVMQRLHVDDLAGHVLAKGGWKHLDLPAIAETEQVIQIGPGRTYIRRIGEPIHPGRESVEDLDRLKHDMGSAAFSAQYQQSPTPLGGNMIKFVWFGQYPFPPKRTGSARIIQSWDTASKADQLNDYSVGITALLIGGAYFILDIVRARLEYPDLRRLIASEAKRWDADTLLIEDKGSGTSLIQDLRREGCFARGVEPEQDKITRMYACSAKIENGSVHLPDAARWLDDFRNEILAFPNGRHDDQADALSQLLNWKRGGGAYTLENVG